MKLIFALIFLLSPFKAVKADIDPLIEKTSRYLIENWYADPSLKESNWFNQNKIDENIGIISI